MLRNTYLQKRELSAVVAIGVGDQTRWLESPNLVRPAGRPRWHAMLESRLQIHARDAKTTGWTAASSRTLRGYLPDSMCNLLFNHIIADAHQADPESPETLQTSFTLCELRRIPMRRVLRYQTVNQQRCLRQELAPRSSCQVTWKLRRTLCWEDFPFPQQSPLNYSGSMPFV